MLLKQWVVDLVKLSLEEFTSVLLEEEKSVWNSRMLVINLALVNGSFLNSLCSGLLRFDLSLKVLICNLKQQC